MPTQADFERVLMNPIFAMGAGLFGGGPNAMMNAYQLVQSNARQKRESQEHEELMKHRQAQTELERERLGEYKTQNVLVQKRLDVESAQAAQSARIRNRFLKELGLDVGDEVAPNAPTVQGMPAAMETASPGFDIDAYAAPVTPQTQLVAQPVDAPKPVAYTGSPEKVSAQHLGNLSPQGKAKLAAALFQTDPDKMMTGISATLTGEEQLRRQAEADKRSEAAQRRAELREQLALEASERSQAFLNLALAREARAGAPRAAPAGGGGGRPAAAPKGGGKATGPAKVTAAEVKRQDAAKATEESRRQVDVMLNDLESKFENLHKKEGLIDPNRKGATGITKNVLAAAGASKYGQIASRAVGTEVQSERDKINTIKPVLMASISKATGVKATQLNSNRELEFYLGAIPDPSLDIEVNRAAIKRLRELFGSPEKIAEFRAMFPAEALEGGSSSGPAKFDDEKERRYQEWKAKQK
jgi:hypothetical protein